MRLLALTYNPTPCPAPKKPYTLELNVSVVVTVMASNAMDALDKVYQDHDLPRDLPWHSTPVMVALLEKNPPSAPRESEF